MKNALQAGRASSMGLCAALLLSVGLGGCASSEPVAGPSTSDLVIRPFEERAEGPSSPGSPCKVGFEVVYPAETPEHDRIIRYRYGYELSPGNPQGALQDGGGPVTLPRPERDRRAVARTDGKVAFRAMVSSFAPCRGPAGSATLEVIVGPCARGDCPPMRYEAPAAGGVAVLRAASAR